MKKIASILLLLILAFNFCGYRILLAYLENKSTIAIEQQIAEGSYHPEQLVEKKVALNIPYYAAKPVYESYSGDVMINGENYRYVKRKIVGDTLYLLCIAHTEKTNLQHAKANFFKLTNDLQNTDTQKGQNAQVAKLLLNEFLPLHYYHIQAPCATVKTMAFDGRRVFAMQQFLQDVYQPPRC